MDTAKNSFLLALRETDSFDMRLGLQACYFNSFLGDGNVASLNLSIQQGRKALPFNETHFDVHCMLGQAYATRYFESGKTKDKRRTLFHYEQSSRLAYQRPDIEQTGLEDRLQKLKEDIPL